MAVKNTPTVKKIAPSILSADFGNLAQEVLAVEAAGADLIHLDVMDGSFVPNLTIGPDIVAAVKRVTQLPLDVHLMIHKPELHVAAFRDAGADIISVHGEATPHLQRTLKLIQSLGASPAVALNPGTPLSTLDWVLDDIAMVLVMTVNPGFGGQSFIPASLPKIKALKEMLIKAGKTHVQIEVDGGISGNNIREVSQAGADIFVAGSAVFKSGDYKTTISHMKSQIAHG